MTILDPAIEANRPVLSDGEKALACILRDPSGIDLAEFAFRDDTKKTKCYRVRPYQFHWWRCPDDRQIDACGRAIALDTPVLMGDGSYIPMGDVAVADTLVDQHGELCSVVEAHEVLHDRPCMAVTFARGETIVADEDHLWPANGPTFDGFMTTRQLAERLYRSDDPQYEGRGHWRVGWHVIVSIEPVPSVPVRCIEVDSPDHTFIIGAQQIPTSNSVGKSERIKSRVAALPYNHPGQEMVLVAPRGNHLDAITQRIEPQAAQCRIWREMLVGGSTSTGVTHRPFVMKFQNGAKFYTRLPGHDGSGVKGIHPVILEIDEGQDINSRTWKELPETVRWEVEGAKMLIHGVTKGVRDTFHDYTFDPRWTRHQFTAIHREDWDAQQKADKIKQYGGSENDPDYQRNVLGVSGNVANRIFYLDWLERCRDDRPASDYNESYFKREITEDVILDAVGARDRRGGLNSSEEQIVATLDLARFPDTHLIEYETGTFWAGMDVGLVGDPSEILVFVEHRPSKAERKVARERGLTIPGDPQETMFRLLVRLSLTKVPDPIQVELIMALIDHYQPKAFSMDSTGLGLPLWQDLQRRAGNSPLVGMIDAPFHGDDVGRLAHYVSQTRARQALTTIKGYGFSKKLLIGIDKDAVDKMGGNPSPAELIERAGIYQNTRDAGTRELRSLVHGQRVRLPDDDELIAQWNAQTEAGSIEPVDAWGNRRSVYSSSGPIHTLDAGRMFALGWAQQRIEKLVAQAEASKRKRAAPTPSYL